MANYREDIVNIELSSGTVTRSELNHTLGGGDYAADRFGVRAYRNSSPENLTGTISGYFIRADGYTVPIASGSVSGNKAYITLPAACYEVEGKFTLSIKLTGNGVNGTVRIVDGTVMRTSTAAAASTTLIPSVESLVEDIAEAVATIPAEYSDLWETFAPVFSADVQYKYGDVVLYDGKLWKCIKDHSGAWSADDFTESTVGTEFNNLKESETASSVPLSWTDNGYINNDGGVTSNTNYAYTDYITIPPNSFALLRAWFAGNTRIAIYDAEKTLTAVYTNEVSQTKLDVQLSPSKNTRYARMSSYITHKPGSFAKIFVLPSNIVSSMGTRVSESNTYLTDCDDAEENSIYTITTAIDHLPNAKSGTLIMLNGDFYSGVNGAIQLYITIDNELFSRIHWGNSGGTWSAWRNLAGTDRAVMEIGTRVTSDNNILTDCDDAVANRVYTIVQAIANCPNKRSGTLLTFNGASSYASGQGQIFVSRYGEVFTRIKWANTWTDWQTGLMDYTEYSGIGLFERFGVIGDSFASGTIMTPGATENTTHYELSWGQILARQTGITCVNYSRGGYNTYDFVDANNANYNTRGLGKVLSDISGGNACGLYILCLGINDSNNTKTFGDKTGGLSYLGSSSDINEDPAQNGNSFWGNYGRIISAIQTASPESRIVMCTFKRNPTTATAEAYDEYREAIVEIAEYFELPCIQVDEDEFFDSPFYMGNMVGSHPTGPQYVGYAKAMERLMSNVMIANYDYFKEYTGV